MLKFIDTAVVMSEVPDEITLAINISGCPNNCKGCHSPWLREDKGTTLSDDVLEKLIEKNDGITCVSIMGGDADPMAVSHACAVVHSNGLKTCWYSGSDTVSPYVNWDNFDYYKLGSFNEKLGPLDVKTTNQRMFNVVKNENNKTDFKDITWKFWKSDIKI